MAHLLRLPLLSWLKAKVKGDKVTLFVGFFFACFFFGGGGGDRRATKEEKKSRVPKRADAQDYDGEANADFPDGQGIASVTP